MNRQAEIERLQLRIYQTSRCIVWLCHRGMRPFVPDWLMDELDAEITQLRAEQEENLKELVQLQGRFGGVV